MRITMTTLKQAREYAGLTLREAAALMNSAGLEVGSFNRMHQIEARKVAVPDSLRLRMLAVYAEYVEQRPSPWAAQEEETRECEG